MRRAARDTSKVKRDTTSLAAPDSMMRALLLRKGYDATRYQGDSVTFLTQNNTLLLFGKPSIVLRQGTQVTGPAITFDDVIKRLTVFGTVTMPGRIHDPSQGQDIVAYDTIKYDINDRHGTAGSVETSADNGAIWCMSFGRAGFLNDTPGGTLLGKKVSLTTDCSPNPHYHFLVNELKRAGKNTLVGSSAKLYIGEVPVLWLPWFWQPENKGRNSGVLTPRFGFAELVRNTASYRRTVENVGFYIAPSQYYDGTVSMDWRSGARPSASDPGFVKLNGELRYHWLDRFITGRLGVRRNAQDNGLTTMSYSLNHDQKFSLKSSVNLSLQYVTNTSAEQRTIINPLEAISTIQSRGNYQTQFGPIRASIGGGQTQYLGRDQIDRDAPTISLTTKTIQIAPWLSWTPSLNTNMSQSLHMDSPTEFGFIRRLGPDGTSDSVRRDRGTRTSSAGFNTPFKIGSFTVTARVSVSDRLNDFPEAKLVVNPTDTSQKRTIVYARTYLTAIDWDFGFNLPQFFQGKWNLTPSVTFRNVDPGQFTVRTERSGSAFVSQSKRPSYGLSISPTLFARLQKGIGPIAAIRHSITPQITYSYSPKAFVSDAYLGALGRTRAGYLGALPQNRVSLTLNQVFEAKLRTDTSAVPGAVPKKIKLLSVNFSPIEYDFELAKATGRLGFATERFSYNLTSDLLPGLSFHVDYSLFDAPVISDTAHFSPYPETVGAALSLGHGSGGLGLLGRFIGWMTGEKRAAIDTARPATDTTRRGGTLQTPQFAAGRSHPALVDLPTARGWQASLNFSSNHPRPPHGSNVIQVDPRAQCDVFRGVNPLQYDICLRQLPPSNTDYSQTSTTGGGVVYHFPATTSITGNMTFNLTPNWAASWQTSYDVVRHEFASQVVSLQRDLHDWKAMFGFQQASNGNFAFNFLITLKPAPDVQFPYNQRSYRSTTSGR